MQGPSLSFRSLCNVMHVMQDMETLVCRQTLAGHKHDVLCISGLQLPSLPRVDSRTTIDGALDSSSLHAQAGT